MAINTFKRYTAASVTSETAVHTAPVATQTTVIGMSIANTSAVDIIVDVKLGTIYMIKQITVAVGGTLIIVGGDQKLVLESGDLLNVTSTETADVIVSVLEIT